MSELRYEPIEFETEEAILATVFDKTADESARRRMIFSAAYFHSEEFFIAFAKRGFDELEPELQNLLLDAIDGYMESRDTVYGVSSLMPRIHRFAERFGEPAFTGTTEIIQDIQERLNRPSTSSK